VPELVVAGTEALVSVDDEATVLEPMPLDEAVDGLLVELLALPV